MSDEQSQPAAIATKRNSIDAGKKKPEDFIFGKVIGDGSFATVYLAKEISTSKEYAIKVLEKRHIIKEKKTEYVRRERDVMSKIIHPFFVKLYFTFQDPDRLYFGLSYAKGGELLDYINKLQCFDENCTRFYTAEIVLSLEYMHGIGIVHRDLKPENILLGEDMHIQITDFGSAKILSDASTSGSAATNSTKDGEKKPTYRTRSFVGTAQYVSPEVLESKETTPGCDLWALGCIVYQLLSGQMPFYGGHEYQIFQKILKLEYEFPEGFHDNAKDLVQKLLVLDSSKRLGVAASGGYQALKSHDFFQGINWEGLPDQTPPKLVPFLPAKDKEDQDLYGKYEPGFTDEHAAALMIQGTSINDATELIPATPLQEVKPKPKKETWLQKTMPRTAAERDERLRQQAATNDYHRFVDGHVILHQALCDKRKGLFARKRMFLLTDGPHLYYVDTGNMVLKGEVPWSKDLVAEAKNFKIFFIHTPNRTYYMEDIYNRNSLDWCNKIQEVWKYYYGPDSGTKK